uniref:Uncharacterized protein n=1 Tax=Romanomermis culicivorax TaxID=13658 RepID=A0A915K0G4_ROMCU
MPRSHSKTNSAPQIKGRQESRKRRPPEVKQSRIHLPHLQRLILRCRWYRKLAERGFYFFNPATLLPTT